MAKTEASTDFDRSFIDYDGVRRDHYQKAYNDFKIKLKSELLFKETKPQSISLSRRILIKEDAPLQSNPSTDSWLKERIARQLSTRSTRPAVSHSTQDDTFDNEQVQTKLKLDKVLLTNVSWSSSVKKPRLATISSRFIPS